MILLVGQINRFQLNQNLQ